MKETARIERNATLELVGGTFGSVRVDNDYFARERRENALEQGFAVYPEPEQVYSDVEHILRRSEKVMSQVENERAGGTLMRERRDRSWPEPNEFIPDFPRQKSIIRIQL